MKQVSHVLREMKTVEELAERNLWANHVHPLAKLILTVVYIAVVVSFSKYDVINLSGMAIYPILLFSLADLSLKKAFYRLRLIIPMICVMGLINPILDRMEIGRIGGFIITSGMVSFFSLIWKGIFCVLAAYYLIATTDIYRICFALEKLHLPDVMVMQILLTYRYLTLFLEEVQKMSDAYGLRAPKQKGISFPIWGSFAGRLLLRSVERAQLIYESMCMRGFKGRFTLFFSSKWRLTDSLYLVIGLVTLLPFRIFPLFFLLGELLKKFI